MNYLLNRFIFCVVAGASLMPAQLCAVENPMMPWTWLYTKKFSDSELRAHAQKSELSFSKQSKPFTQLVFSWNAQRPPEGFFSFWVKVRNQKTQQWGSWHKMMAWGNKVQASYLTRHDSWSKYEHVRFEVDPSHQADAFVVKIKTHEGANLAHVQGFNVSISDFNKFSAESPQGASRLPSVYIETVPHMCQFALEHPDRDVICSPTSCTMLASYLTKTSLNPVTFADHVYDSGLGIYGSWPFNIAHAYEHCSHIARFAVARFNSFAYLHRCLTKGVPVVVSVRGPLQGAPKPYAKGHLLVVVGWDQSLQQVICHDPAVTGNEVVITYDIKSFLEAWERSRRLVYLAIPNAHT